TEIPEAIKQGFSKYPITDRKVYHYSEDEVERIVKEAQSEEMRGSKPRYWEDVNVGDKLKPVVKGPLTSADLLHYSTIIWSSSTVPGFELRYRRGLMAPRYLRPNVLMGWPIDMYLDEHMDPNMSGVEGMGTNTFALGTLRVGLCTHLLSNWMGDDGFIRRLNVDVLEPYIYGDTLWISGKVVEKYKEKLGGILYGAVEIKLEAVNQLGQKLQPAIATVYLPSRGYEVKLPIPQ
ncbi:hypothetical protein MUP77_08255, partial [Candidatus Bathyarchaeota archaeon]|nr:hypothetical protein [Candidatus Bathyarchaeota archaeon]